LLPFGHAAVAADERAGHVEEIIDILGKRAAIVDAGSGETVSGGEQEGEPAAQTETDDADASIAARLSEKPASGGFYVIEGGPVRAVRSRITCRMQMSRPP